MIYDNIAIIKDNKRFFKYTNIVISVYIFFISFSGSMVRALDYVWDARTA